MYANVLRKWVRELAADPGHASPDLGQIKPEQMEIDRLRLELAKLKTERHILKKPPPTSRGTRHEIAVRREASRDLAGGMDVRGARCLAKRLPCLADPPAVAACPRRRGDRREGPRQPCRKLLHLWCAPCLACLLADGISCGPHRIERLMREQDLRARARRRWLPKDDGDHSVITGNVLDRQFTADRPNQKWVADFT